MDVTQNLSLALGAAWASGINLYAAVFTLGLMHSTGNYNLPPELQVLANPMVIAAAGFMYCVEFFADKIPGVDSLWDALHSFIRIPAGAILASKAIGPVDPALEYTALLVGGTLAAATHSTKSASRLLINTSPEPFSNWAASFTEDIMVFAGVWVALQHPYLFLVLLTLFIILLACILPFVFKGLKAIANRLGSLFRRRPPAESASPV